MQEREQELQPKVEVTLGPGTVVFIAAVVGEGEDQEMLPVRYDARFDKVRVECPPEKSQEGGCTEIHLRTIGFPRAFAANKAEEIVPCAEPFEIVGVVFNGRQLKSTDPPRRARRKKQSAWFAAGYRVDDGVNILASYSCPAIPEAEAAQPPS